MIAVDWGTSSLRCYRLDAQGKIIESRTSTDGILNVPAGRFADVLQQQIAGWSETPIVMSGMVGSRQGWKEAPYIPCPAGFDEIAANLLEVRPGVWIVPGLSCRDAAGVPDVMRGEETQILGCGMEGTICLPGTHSKWAEVKNGRVERFSTFMTGEVYAVLRQHSILGRMMQDAAPDHGAFAQGVQRAGEGGGLLHHVFGVRTRGLLDGLQSGSSASYLSGILIGHELRSRAIREMKLVGEPSLVALYAQAADALGIATKTLDPASGVRALFRLGQLVASRA